MRKLVIAIQYLAGLVLIIFPIESIILVQIPYYWELVVEGSESEDSKLYIPRVIGRRGKMGNSERFIGE